MNRVKLTKSQPSLFAQMVDQLRNKSEAELKLLYTRFFQKEFADEWSMITKDTDFNNVSETSIIKAIQKNRYHK
ncbi:MAG: hypothetical protein ABIN67_23410 [Ferruginibacter sp.]